MMERDSTSRAIVSSDLESLHKYTTEKQKFARLKKLEHDVAKIMIILEDIQRELHGNNANSA